VVPKSATRGEFLEKLAIRRIRTSRNPPATLKKTTGNRISSGNHYLGKEN
jgi:hypothetical protein